ncbi:MAG: thioredoxin domain-containing protein, partial [Myxococcota bacterium]
RKNYIKWAKQLGLDVERFTKDIDSRKYRKYVEADNKQAGSIGAQGTPTFFVNGYKIVGAQPFPRFKQAIDALLAGKPFPGAAQRPTRPRPDPNKRYPVKVAKHSPAFGPTDAKVTVVEFSDFECPFCSRGAKVINQIKKNYGNKVRIVFRHLPLGFHKQAKPAAEASMAAHAQGKFWAYHDKLFANQRRLNRKNYIKWAKQLGLDVARFTKDIDSGKYRKAVEADAIHAGSVGANGTPTFFVNGLKIVGAQPFARFQSVIDAELSGKKQPALAAPPVPKPAKPVEIRVGSAPSFGPVSAPVTIVEFSDFECPFCSRGANVVHQIKKTYGDKVRVVFKQLPLPFHKQAK